MDASAVLDPTHALISSVEQGMLNATTATCSEPHSAMHAAHYHLRSGGQRVRARLALRAGLALGLSDADAVRIACCAELLHNAALIHDDLQDEDRLRRNQPAVWAHYNPHIAICAGDLMLSAAYSSLCQLSQPERLGPMLACIHHCTANAIDGQCADLAAPATQPIGRYLAIARAKSGALLSLPIELALLAAGHDTAIAMARRAAEDFSIAYQIADDLDDSAQDAAHRRPGINLILILETQDPLCDAQAMAQALALQHIAQVQIEAANLPCGAGAFLLQLAAQLETVLRKESPGCTH